MLIYSEVIPALEFGRRHRLRTRRESSDGMVEEKSGVRTLWISLWLSFFLDNKCVESNRRIVINTDPLCVRPSVLLTFFLIQIRLLILEF